MAMQQIMTKEGNIHSINMDGSASVEGIKVYQHAGDHKDGINSFIIVGVAYIRSIGSFSIDHKFTREHGLTEERVRKLAGDILVSGKFNLSNWSIS